MSKDHRILPIVRVTFPQNPRCRRRGSALVAVLSVIILLGMMIFTAGILVRGDAELATSQKRAFRATQLAEMGIAIAANPVVKKTDLTLLNQKVGDEESFSVKIRTEAKFNINTLVQQAKADPNEGRRFLEIVLAAVGVGAEDPDSRRWLIDNMINWTDPDDMTDGDKDTYEKEQYEAEGQFNYPFNRPFYNLDEVLLVKGMNVLPGVCPQWRDIFTVYNQGKLDVTEASAECLAIASLQGIDEAQRYYEQQLAHKIDDRERPSEHYTDAQQVVETRWGRDQMEDTTDDEKMDVNTVATMLNLDPELANVRLTNQDQTTRIEATATVGDFTKRIVVIMRNRTQNPQILMREEVPIF